MDFSSIRRKHRISQPSARRKTFSASNLSCISYNSTSIGRKTVYVTLPKDFGCDVDLEGKIVHMRRGGPAHAVGILQIGDYLRFMDGNDSEQIVKLQVTFGVLQIEMRPNCPLVIEIGNRSYTSLGIALSDSSDNRIQISSVQPGSLADRCGYLQPGDILTSIYISSDETLPCSPFYNSYQIAQILRQLTSKNSFLKMTILPSSHNFSTEDIDIHSGSESTLCDSDSNYGMNKTFKRQIEKVEELDEENNGSVVVCLYLYKDPLYEDWGFSLVDQNENDIDCEDNESEVDNNNSAQKSLLEEEEQNKTLKGGGGSIVFQIRPGGPGYVAGLLPSDRIIQINGRDVSKLESTMLVPILASLDDALNLTILRDPNSISSPI